MTFYQECFGGELTFRTLAESPNAGMLPERMKGYILHASLRNGDWTLMGSDMVSDDGLIKGNAVSIMIECDSLEEMSRYYMRLTGNRLLAGLNDEEPDEALFDDLTDKYGNHWLLNFKL